MATDEATQPLTYGAYLRVPELLELQTPLGRPDVHDEMLFIILQQAQELWFKQVLHELRTVVRSLQGADLPAATRFMGRVNRIMRVLGEEVEVMETLSPGEFQRFRYLLSPSSGFESEQFRELEYASGLNDPSYLKMLERTMDLPAIKERWPVTLHEALNRQVAAVDPSPSAALTHIYSAPDDFPALHALAEALSEYEMQFLTWRFRHMKLVERVIGNRSPGTGGSAGMSYLMKTLQYRFFPELWEARNRITEESSRGQGAVH